MKTITATFVKFSVVFLISLFLVNGLGSFARAENKDLENAGDILQFLIPAAGLAGTYVADDPEGRSPAVQPFPAPQPDRPRIPFRKHFDFAGGKLRYSEKGSNKLLARPTSCSSAGARSL